MIDYTPRARHWIISVLILLALALAGGTPASAATEHCPDHNGHPGKVEGGNNNDIVLDAGMIFCVKGSTDATGIIVADGETPLVDYLGNGHDVSYYIVYGRQTGTTEPSPSATSTPQESTDVTPTVSPSATPDESASGASVTVLPDTAAEASDQSPFLAALFLLVVGSTIIIAGLLGVYLGLRRR